MTASTTEHKWTDSDGTVVTDNDGTIVVSGATYAYIYVTLGTDYEVNYLNYCNDKPTYTTTLADMRVKVTLACTECKQRNYVSKKNKKNDPDRLEMNKHCKFCRKHTLHRETK
jgi:large subunit ribosomal protein L33